MTLPISEALVATLHHSRRGGSADNEPVLCGGAVSLLGGEPERLIQAELRVL